jgi:acetyl esterase
MERCTVAKAEKNMSLPRNPQTLLTPAMRSVLARMGRAGHPALHSLTPIEARAAYAAGADVLEPPSPPMGRVENFSIAARDGFAIPVRLVAPSEARLPVLVYFHGGGFTIGSVETHDGLCRQLAHRAQCAVLSVDFRLAPEYKFPFAVNDAWDAVQWAVQQGGARNILPTQVAVGGDSAGGTLAAVCAILARNANIPLALQLLFYPGTAAHQQTDSHRVFADGFVLEASHISYFFNHYLRSPGDWDDWRFAPLDGHDTTGQIVELDGVAPAWFGLAECDPLVDEGVHYADRVVHEFIKMGRAIPEASSAQADAARALVSAFKETA